MQGYIGWLGCPADCANGAKRSAALVVGGINGLSADLSLFITNEQRVVERIGNGITFM